MSDDSSEDLDFDDDEGLSGNPPAPTRFIVVMRPPEEALKLETQLVKRGFTGIMARSRDELLQHVTQHLPFALVYCRAQASDSTLIDEVLALSPGIKIVQLHGRYISCIAGTIGDTPDLLAALVQAGIRLSPRFMPHGFLDPRRTRAA